MAYGSGLYGEALFGAQASEEGASDTQDVLSDALAIDEVFITAGSTVDVESGGTAFELATYPEDVLSIGHAFGEETDQIIIVDVLADGLSESVADSYVFAEGVGTDASDVSALSSPDFDQVSSATAHTSTVASGGVDVEVVAQGESELSEQPYEIILDAASGFSETVASAARIVDVDEVGVGTSGALDVVTVDVEAVAFGHDEGHASAVVDAEAVGEAASDAFDLAEAVAPVLESAAMAADEAFVSSQTTLDVLSPGVGYESAFYKNPGAIAWVMNTETGAPSWYSNWQFVDMVQIKDRVLAVGPEGLVELGADSDSGDEIDAELAYGFTDFGPLDRSGNRQPDERKKRIDAFWFGYTSSGVVEVEVETIDSPPYDYRMQPRNADSPRNNRVRPGKGLNARYWRIKVRNSGGADLAVDSISADAAPSTRRL